MRAQKPKPHVYLRDGKWRYFLNGFPVGIGVTLAQAFEEFESKRLVHVQRRTKQAAVRRGKCVQCGAPWYATWDDRCRKCSGAVERPTDFHHGRRKGTKEELPACDPFEAALFGKPIAEAN